MRKPILYLDSDRALISNVPRGSELIFLEQPYEALLGAREAREARSGMPAFRVGQLAKLYAHRTLFLDSVLVRQKCTDCHKGPRLDRFLTPQYCTVYNVRRKMARSGVADK